MENPRPARKQSFFKHAGPVTEAGNLQPASGSQILEDGDRRASQRGSMIHEGLIPPAMQSAILFKKRKEEEKIEMAGNIVRDCISGRAPNLHSKSADRRRYYDFYYHQATRYFVICTILVHMVFSTFELRPMYWNLDRDPRCWDNPNMIRAFFYTTKVELLFLAVYWADITLKFLAKGRKVMKGNWNKLIVGVVSLITLDVLLANANAFRGVVKSADGIRFGRPLRPVLMMAMSSSLRKHVRSLIRTLYGVKYLLALMGLSIIVFSLAGVIFVRAICPSCDGYIGTTARLDSCYPATFGSSCYSEAEAGCIDLRRTMCNSMLSYFDDSIKGSLSFFVLMTTENFPDIWYPFINFHVGMSIFFFVFMVMAVYMFLSVLFAVVFDEYKKHQTREILKVMGKTDLALLSAFKLLRNTKDVITFDKYERMMKFVLPGAKSEHVKLYFAYLDEDGSGSIDALEFIELTEILALRVSEEKENIWHKRAESLGAIGTGLNVMKPVVRNWWFNRGGETVIILNLCLLILATSLPPASPAQKVFSILEPILLGLFGVEVVCRVLAVGLSFLGYYWLVFDVVIFLLGILLQVSKAAPTLATVGRVVRIVRIFLVSPKFEALLKTFIQIIPGLLSFLAFELCLVYFFAAVGVMLFQCILPQNTLNADYSDVFDFDTISGSLMVMFQIIIINNWNNVIDRVTNATNIYYSLFFILYFVIVVLVATNLLFSLIVEAYLMHNDDNERFVAARNSRHSASAADSKNPSEKPVVKIKLKQTNEQKLALHLAKLDPQALRSREDRIEELAAKSQVNLVALKKEKDTRKGSVTNLGTSILESRASIFQQGGEALISGDLMNEVQTQITAEEEDERGFEIEAATEQITSLLSVLKSEEQRISATKRDGNAPSEAESVLPDLLGKISDLILFAEEAGADMSTEPFSVALNHLARHGWELCCDSESHSSHARCDEEEDGCEADGDACGADGGCSDSDDNDQDRPRYCPPRFYSSDTDSPSRPLMAPPALHDSEFDDVAVA